MRRKGRQREIWNEGRVAAKMIYWRRNGKQKTEGQERDGEKEEG